MLLQRGLRLEVGRPGDVVGASEPELLKISGNLAYDSIVVVGDHHLVAIKVQIVEPSI